MVKEIFEPVFQVMDGLFWPLFHLTANPEFNTIVGVMLVSLLISALIFAITNKVVDQKRMKELKAKTASYQEKIKEAKKRRDLEKVSSIQKVMMKYQKEMMGLSMRPMMYTMIPIVVIFTWLRQYDYLNDFVAQQGYLIALPFVLPKFGSTLGWFGWYLLCSFPMSVLIKKIFKIEGP
jgi:uncharacterized membrane protein (DUF106 family)